MTGTVGTPQASEQPIPAGQRHAIRAAIRPFETPDRRRTIIQLVVSLALFFGAVRVELFLADIHFALALLAAPLAGLLNLRLFVIQHDFGHHALFRSRLANEVWGFILGVFTLIPHQYWWKGHLHHHRTANNLDQQNLPFAPFLAKRDYERLAPWRQRLFRISRNAWLLYFLVYPLGFCLYYRLPLEMKGQSRASMVSFAASNTLSLCVLAAITMVVGWRGMAVAYFPVLFFAGGIGMWLCTTQHLFTGTSWYRDPRWDHMTAAIEGTSFLVLPCPLEWLLARLNHHNLHHLSPRIPNYHLRAAAAALVRIQAIKAISLMTAIRSVRLVIWDEDAGELVQPMH